MFGIIMNSHRHDNDDRDHRPARPLSKEEMKLALGGIAAMMVTVMGIAALGLGFLIHDTNKQTARMDGLAADFAKAATDLPPAQQDKLKDYLSGSNFLFAESTADALQTLKNNHVTVTFAKAALPGGAIVAIEPGKISFSPDDTVFADCGSTEVLWRSAHMLVPEKGAAQTGLFKPDPQMTSTGARYCELVPAR